MSSPHDLARRWIEAAKNMGEQYAQNIGKIFKRECDDTECPFWREPDRCIASKCIKEDSQ